MNGHTEEVIDILKRCAECDGELLRDGLSLYCPGCEYDYLWNILEGRNPAPMFEEDENE